MSVTLTRPTQEQYSQALEYYRTGATLEIIAERLDLELDVLEHLESEGWPEDGDLPALPALRSQVFERLTRIRAGELDLLTSVAETASKTSPTRSRTGQLYAQIEYAIVSLWSKQVHKVMKSGRVEVEPGRMRDVEPSDLVVPKTILDNLKALRALQDPEIDRGFVDIFVKMKGRGPEDGGSSLEDEIVRDLAGLSKEDLEVYVQTGKIPERQQELPFVSPGKKGEAA